jgi:hypothetical protein
MRFLLSVFLTSILTSCATSRFETKEVKKVKTVAVVGQLLTQDKLKDAQEVKDGIMDGLMQTGLSLMGLGGTKTEENPMMSSENLTKESKHAEAVFKNFNKQLGEKTNWKIVSMNSIAKNHQYMRKLKTQEQKYYFSNSRGPKEIEKFKTNQSFHPLTIQIMHQEDRDELMTSLNVDAIAAASYKTKLGRSEMFSEDIEATTSMQLQLFTKGKSESIIYEDYKGEPFTDGKAKAGIIGYSEDKALVNDLIISSTLSANNNFIKNLNKQLK